MRHIGKGFYNKYRNHILLNKSIIVAGIAALIVGTIFTEFYSKYEKNNFFNSIVTLTVEYSIYIPIFAFYFYHDNKNKYIDPVTGLRDKAVIKNDIIKLFTIFSVSEIIYSVSKVSIHFQLMQISFEPYQASMIGSIAAWIIFLVLINLGAKFVRLFKK
ncbi:MAG TPA: hypothetical protein VD694_01510 [Nitrososphaeraceae archaeon]|nr:hypothetical protein [Nitrososphaeraceae archaeon]